MAQTKTRRSGSSAGSSRRNGSSPSRGRSPARRAPTRTRAASSSRRSSNARSSPRSRSNASRAGKARSRSTSRPSTNGVSGAISGIGSSIGSAVGKAGDSVGTVAQRAKTPALVGTAAAAGLAGGVALRSRMLSRPKLAGIPLKRNGAFKSVAREMQEVGKEIGRTGFRLGVGDVNMEVQRGGRKENRDSPLEVLLHSLTSRRSRR